MVHIRQKTPMTHSPRPETPWMPCLFKQGTCSAEDLAIVPFGHPIRLRDAGDAGLVGPAKLGGCCCVLCSTVREQNLDLTGPAIVAESRHHLGAVLRQR